jgi:hypothetical protein
MSSSRNRRDDVLLPATLIVRRPFSGRFWVQFSRHADCITESGIAVAINRAADEDFAATNHLDRDEESNNEQPAILGIFVGHRPAATARNHSLHAVRA